MSGFEWDETKNASNLAKHGIRFEEAATIFEGPVLTSRDDRHDDEIREISYGLIGGRIAAAVVHTDRGENIRIISARKASKRETKLYHDHLKKALS